MKRYSIINQRQFLSMKASTSRLFEQFYSAVQKTMSSADPCWALKHGGEICMFNQSFDDF